MSDFKGSMHSVTYSLNGHAHVVDLLDVLANGHGNEDTSVLVDGSLRLVSAHSADDVAGGDDDESSDGGDGAVTLGADSFLKVDKLTIGNEVSLSFRTSESDGLLVLVSLAKLTAASSANYMAVEMSNGSLSLLVRSAKHQQRLECSATGRQLNDNKWHTLVIRRERLGAAAAAASSIMFACDESHESVKSRLAAWDKDNGGDEGFVIMSPESPLVQLQAGNWSSNVPSELWLAAKANFVGCLKDLKVCLNNKNLS